MKREPPQNTNQIHQTLVSQIAEATARASAANKEFHEVLGRFPGGPAHPGGVQQIKNASRKLTVTREEMMAAHRQLDEYKRSGIVPDDLKQEYERPDDLKRSG
jgi:hypothetical protein